MTQCNFLFARATSSHIQEVWDNFHGYSYQWMPSPQLRTHCIPPLSQEAICLVIVPSLAFHSCLKFRRNGTTYKLTHYAN